MAVIDGTSRNDTITPTILSAGVTPHVFPSNADDELHGHGGSDTLNGGGGDDFLFGDDLDSEKGNDFMDGGAGADIMSGHAGNDTYVVDNAGDQIIESTAASGGVDTVRSSTITVDLSNYGFNVSGLENITLTGSRGLAGLGNDFSNVITGNGGGNLLVGFAGDDTLDGGGGKDTLQGQAGADILVGGAKADVLIGGLDADTFQFRSASDSTPSAPDQIEAGDGAPAFEGAGSSGGDRIDVSGIDANATAGGNQTFAFGGGTGKGHLTLVDSGTDTIVRGNTDNDAAFEFQLVIHDGNTVSAANYSAGDFLL